MLFLFLLLVGLGLALRTVWERLAETRAQQARLSDDYLKLRRRQDDLEQEVRTLRGRAGASMSSLVPVVPVVPVVPLTTDTPTPTPSLQRLPTAAQPPALPDEQLAAGPVQPAPPSPRAARRPPGGVLYPDAPADSLESVASAVRSLVAFFTTGNVVAKVGVVILFFGVAFLLKYASERGMLPIEYRLMAAAIGALVLLGVGWRLRDSHREYGLTLQGGAVGLLYLTIFAAFRLYDLLPAALTFSLLLVTVAFSGVLAVVQNALVLAVLGTSGGFFAPILASTGGGSHVALFSYYAVLNIGVLGIAWFRAWRFLNWLAFVFTFGIGLLWGQEYYQPGLFTTTEPFLVLFFLLFLAVAVLFAHRQPPHLKGYIDGSLVFGTPAIAFAMQSVLAGGIPFGRAYSAVVLSGLYLALTRLLWRRAPALRPLAEAFLALAVVFLILAVPLAFDGHATAAAWALEGAGLIWIGIRQQRRLARVTGAALLLGAGMAFGALTAPPSSGLAVLNTRFLGCVAIAAGSVVAGRLLAKARDQLSDAERPLEWVLLVWGLLWWFGAMEVEILDHVPSRLIVSSSLLGVAVSGCLVAFIARRWEWRPMMLATLPIGPLLWIWALPLFALAGLKGPWPDLGWLAWTAVVACGYLLAFWFESVWPRLAVLAWHTGTAWLMMFLTTWTLAAIVRQLVPDTPTWSSTIWCIVPGLFVLAVRGLSQSLSWPVRRFTLLYTVGIPAAPIAGMLLWVAWACGQEGAAAPLPYLPVLNPLELTQAFAIITSYAWWHHSGRQAVPDDVLRSAFTVVLAVLAFTAINVVVARGAHVYLEVPFEVDVLADSSVVQTGISILWGVTAGVLMALARRRLDRLFWMVGAGLLAALTLKLFVIDLGKVGGVARIVSFLATGIVILLIGYFAPVPPKSPAGTEPAT